MKFGASLALALFSLSLFLVHIPCQASDIPGDPDSLPGWLGEKMRRPPETLEPKFDRRRIIQLSAQNPRAYLYKGFLTYEECDHLVEKAKPGLERSKVTGGLGNKGEVSEIRTSTGSFLPKQQDPVVKSIEERIEQWTFLPIANQEPLQILRYLEGQKYVPHYDYFPTDFNKQQGGQRYATVLMYLNNVTRGGETVFSNAKDPTPKDDTWSECAKGYLAVKPEKGDALLFFSMHPDGTPDPFSLHYACPVVEGVKWSAPKWIHVRDYDVPWFDPTVCENSNAQCEFWASLGECKKNPKYMLSACRLACKACTPTKSTE